ncbi:hypothetical protein NDU88_001097 [Pleurodeles waltl]|uniref:Uncharacterized protein n=1 Tax=Pleurodeles waltl TaxID=8319 RepID=A0AAV7U7I5_PLEWA|nr:hypothetical protein NDU88_001097 [Pleurodeles waltl]
MGVPNRTVTWRLDAWELKDRETKQMVTTATARYFAENEGSFQSAAHLWKAYKAILRDQLISQRAGLRRDREEECRNLEEKLLQ